MQTYFSEERTLNNRATTYLPLFFSGCNFNCPYCNTPELMISKEEQLFDDELLKRMIEETEHDYILFTGGEPTMQRQSLLYLMAHARKQEKRTVLHTNGSKPDALKSLIKEGLLDQVMLDIKSPLEKDIFQKVTKSGTFFKPVESVMSDVKETIRLLKESKLNTLVLLTIVPGLLFRKEDVHEIAKIAHDLDASLILQQFDNASCNDTRFMSIKPASLEFLQTLKDSINKEFPEMKVTIRTGPLF